MCWIFKPKKAKFEPGDPPWLLEAIKEQGVKEISGSDHNDRILLYHKYTDLKAGTDETPWCSAFLNFIFSQCNIPGTNKPSARSWLIWGQAMTTPKRGAVAIFWRGSKNSWMGHCGLFIKEKGKYVYVIGGNQSNKVKVSRYPKSRLIGYRWIKETA